jgi:hypothetical protein
MDDPVRLLAALLPLAALAGAYSVIFGYALAGDRRLCPLARFYAALAVLASGMLYWLV